ncbi:hypothetical protein ABID19_002459 [Mesorhizobium robiniae]|uniref:Uncharacterized protein n=1 Tax=Mesorhizobium robiniae TaxID=559315 RepID=A0ABV2GMD7_9HYPH
MGPVCTFHRTGPGSVDPPAFNMKAFMTLHIGRSNEMLTRVQRAY